MSDIRTAFRQFNRRPGFSLLAILTLGLGIGATTAVFSVVNSVLIQPLPYPDADRVVAVWQRATFQGVTTDSMNLSPPMYFKYAEHSETLQYVGVWSRGTANVTGLGEPEQVQTFVTTHEVLPALGIQPALGRWFSAEDDTPGSAETVILTYSYWQSRFGGDPGVIGRAVDVDSRPREVVGVMPRGFGWSNDPQLILPQRFDRGAVRVDTFNYYGVARLEAGVTIEQVNGDLTRALQATGDGFDVSGMVAGLELAPAVRSLKQDVVGSVDDMLWMVLGAIGLVLVIACANVASLLLVRADGRSDELGTRVALGASPRRIARLLLLESAALAAAGGALGIALAYGALRILITLNPANLPRLDEIAIDSDAVLFTVLAALVSGLVVGLAPVLRYGRGASTTRTGSRATATREKQRVQNALVVGQCALACTLLIASGLMIRSFVHLHDVDAGFVRPEQVQTLRIMISETEVPDLDSVVQMQKDMLDRVAALPGVDSAAFGSGLPTEQPNGSPIGVEGVTPEGEVPPIRRTKLVSPGYFGTLGISLLTGRDFDWTDVYDEREVAIVSAQMARETWGSADAALGKRIRIGATTQWREVIGVADDVYEDGTNQAAPSMVYWRTGVQYLFGMQAPPEVRRQITFAIRSDRTGTESFLAEVREAIWSVSRIVPLASIQTLEEMLGKSFAATSFTLVMLGIAGGMALLIGVVGIYGVIAYMAARRYREIGVRLALGARDRDVQMLFVRHGLLLAAIGVTIGVGASIGLMRLLSSLLFGVNAVDPVTYIVGATVLLIAAVFASYVPARRALSTDPLGSLKAD
jgi:putative ABC transport system permease protein